MREGICERHLTRGFPDDRRGCSSTGSSARRPRFGRRRTRARRCAGEWAADVLRPGRAVPLIAYAAPPRRSSAPDRPVVRPGRYSSCRSTLVRAPARQKRARRARRPGRRQLSGRQCTADVRARVRSASDRSSPRRSRHRRRGRTSEGARSRPARARRSRGRSPRHSSRRHRRARGRPRDHRRPRAGNTSRRSPRPLVVMDSSARHRHEPRCLRRASPEPAPRAGPAPWGRSRRAG